MTTSRWLSLALLGSLVAPLLLACGGGTKKVDAEEWAADFCGATQDFVAADDDLEAEFDKIDFDDDKAMDEFVALLKDRQKAFEEFQDEVDGLGQPDIDAGEDVVKTVKEALDDYRDYMEKVIGIVEDENDLFDALDAASEEEEPEGVRERLAALEDNDVDDLIDAMDEEDDCLDELGPGGGGTEAVAVDEWTEGFCVALLSWLDDISAASTETNFDSATSGQQVKTMLVDYFKEVTQRSIQLEDDVLFLGRPDIDDGEEIHEALLSAIADVVGIFEDSLSDVESLDASNEARMEQELLAITDRLNEAGDRVGEAFDQINRDYDVGPIEDAALDLPECEGVF